MFGKKHQKNQNQKNLERRRVLEFIANNAAKKDFIEWLNVNYEQQFPEDVGWDKLQRLVKVDSSIHTSALHNYAGTLTDEEDVTKLLKDVEKETTKAEEVVSELYDDANDHKLEPIVGGASLLGGFLLLVLTAGLVTGAIELTPAQELSNYIAAAGGLFGVLNIFSGILLILK